MFQKNTTNSRKENMEEVIKKWLTGKDKELEELISTTKERDVCQIEICDLGKTFCNHKQVIAHSSKKHEKFASNVQSEEDAIQKEKTMLFNKVKIIQKDNSDITGELSNIGPTMRIQKRKFYSSILWPQKKLKTLRRIGRKMTKL